jgi:hypothetical protein
MMDETVKAKQAKRFNMWKHKETGGNRSAIFANEYGKVAPSDAELNALQTNPVRIVALQAPELIHPEVTARKPLKEADQAQLRRR